MKSLQNIVLSTVILGSLAGAVNGEDTYRNNNSAPKASSKEYKAIEPKLLFDGKIDGNEVKLTDLSGDNKTHTLSIKNIERNYGVATKSTFSEYQFDPITNKVFEIDIEVRKRNFTKTNTEYKKGDANPYSRAAIEEANKLIPIYLRKIEEKIRFQINHSKIKTGKTYYNWLPQRKPDLRNHRRPFNINTRY